jgi:drug/metabolite transporter (DMT)-like permease
LVIHFAGRLRPDLMPRDESMTPRAATGVGLIAVLLWASLATLTVLAKGLPPLQLEAMSFALGTLVGVVYLAASPSARRDLRQLTLPAVLLGVGGLLGYHFFYFLSLSSAPPLQANLVNNLWPLLIVLFSALLPGEQGRLRWNHILGALLALGGAVLAITGGRLDISAFSGAALGYAAALCGALTWSSYSVLTRLFAAVPSSAVTIYCATTAAGAALGHGVVEETVWPLSGTQWLAVALLGLGPVGIAFYVWDYGCKHGDLRVLGAAAYFAPLVSSAMLMVLGFAEASPTLWIAASAITAGALLAAKDLLLGRAPASSVPPHTSHA